MIVNVSVVRRCKRLTRKGGKKYCSHGKRPCRWGIMVDYGYTTDPVTGKRRRRLKMLTFRGTEEDANTKRDEIAVDLRGNTYVDRSKMTLGEWLDEWLEKAIKPPRRTQRSYEAYKGTIAKHLKPALGSIRLQDLTALDIERYHADLKLSPGSGQTHHAILNSALKAAAKAKLVKSNVATDVEGKPRAKRGNADVLTHVWEAREARKFLVTAKAAGPQAAAFYTLALDSGARKSELAAVRWSDLDIQTGRLTIARQLVKNGREPIFGPTKTKRARTIELADETLVWLRTHKAHQAEIKLRNRTTYRDFGLIFAKEWGDLYNQPATLGGPLQVNNIAEREFDKLIAKAEVRRIKFHGMRHTCATLMLSAGVPPNVVQHRLGHSKVTMTLDIYAHALPTMQQDAASRLAAMLHG